jgi:uncharacterized protein (TIGR04255 family)
VPDKGNRARPLASFDNPPVVETVLGVEFAPLRGWDVRHFGLFWGRVKGRFGALETKPALIRPEAGEAGPFNFVLEQLRDPAGDVRCWLIDEDETRLLQIQQDRFIHNWRKVQGDEPYPRYDDDIKPRFRSEWENFVAFLEEEGLPRPEWRRCEVTYINHLEKGREWRTLDDLPEIFPAFRSGALAGPELSLPESVNIRWRHRLEAEAGWLTFALQSATRHRDDKKVLQYQISAQVEAPEESDLSAVFDALDRGRYSVVRSFETSTSPRMHDLWGRKERVA